MRKFFSILWTLGMLVQIPVVQPSNGGLTNPVVTGFLTDTAVKTGTASNTDTNFKITITNPATTVTYTFAQTYVSAPSCLVQPIGSTPSASQALSGYVPSTTTTVLTITVGITPGAGTPVTFQGTCTGFN